MYSSPQVLEAFIGAVGIRPPYDNTIPVPAEYLQQSSTGLWLQDLHPLCSLENIYNAAPDFSRYEYPAWENKVYTRGTLVAINDKVFRAATNIAVGYPAPEQAGSENWILTDPWSEWLRSRMESAVNDTLSGVMRVKRLLGSTKSIVDELMLFDGIGSYSDRIIKNSRFVGLEISVLSEQGLTALIQAIGLQKDAPQAITMYLYHTSQRTPLETIELQFNGAGGFTWAKPVEPLALQAFNYEHSGEGSFLLGYYEDDLVGATQAIRRETGFVSICATCNAWNTWSFNQWSKHLSIRPFSIAGAEMVDRKLPELFTENTLTYDLTNNWGLNLKISVICDMSNMFMNSIPLLANAYAMRVSLKFLAEVAYSHRINVISERTKALAMADLNPESKEAVAYQWQKELEALSLDYSGMSTNCMPVQGKTFIKQKAI